MSVYGFYKTARLVHFLNKDNERDWKNKYTRLRGVAEKLALSSPARQKLEWIILYQTVGRRNASYVAKYFGITRKTLHKWLKRFDEGNLRTLEESSRAPIERVVRRHNLYREKQVRKAYTKAKRDKKRKVLIYDIEKKNDFGFLWHIDAIIIWWYGTRRVIFTAIEDITKIAFARIYTTNSSNYSTDFLKRLMYLVEGSVEIMHSDNGSEFEKDFEKACGLLNIQQVYSRPRTPTDNPALERFNWTLQDEWLELSDVGLDDIDEGNKDFTNWLIEYNNYRPHESLDYLTPLEYAQQNFYKVLPMWSARTITFLFCLVC